MICSSGSCAIAGSIGTPYGFETPKIWSNVCRSRGDRRRSERVDDRDRLSAAVDAGGVQSGEVVRVLELRRRVAADAEQRDARRRRPRLCLCLALQRLADERPEGRPLRRAARDPGCARNQHERCEGRAGHRSSNRGPANPSQCHASSLTGTAQGACVLRGSLKKITATCNSWRARRKSARGKRRFPRGYGGGEDLNLRSACTDNGFRDRRIRPLCHPSGTPSVAATARGYGEGGIRTLEAGISPPNALAGRRLQPLGHFSGRVRARTLGPECNRDPGAFPGEAGRAARSPSGRRHRPLPGCGRLRRVPSP